MPPISTAISLRLPFRGLAHDSRGVVDRLDDVHVAGAAAEVSRDRLAYLQLRRFRVRREEGDRGHHHSGRAEAALQPVLLMEAFLDRMELAILLEPLDSRDRSLIGLNREHRARLHRAAVHENGARAAVGRIAADVRAGHPEVLAEEVDEKRARLDFDVVRDAVDGHADLEGPLPTARGRRRLNSHDYFPPVARATALRIARCVSTRITSSL